MMLPPSCGFEPMTYGLQSSASVCLPSVPPRTVTKVRLRGTSLTSPAAIACLTASKPAGKDNAPAKATLDSMKSRRVGSRPQMWLSIPIPFCLRLPDLVRHGPSPGVRLPITLRRRPATAGSARRHSWGGSPLKISSASATVLAEAINYALNHWDVDAQSADPSSYRRWRPRLLHHLVPSGNI